MFEAWLIALSTAECIPHTPLSTAPTENHQTPTIKRELRKNKKYHCANTT